MGVQNRQRRKQKKAKRERQQRSAAGAGRARHDDWGAAFQLGVVYAIREAAEAVFHDRDDAAEAVELLVAGPPVPGGRSQVARMLADALELEVEALVVEHWRPHEITRLMRRRVGTRGEEIAAAAIPAGWRRAGDRVPDPASALEAMAVGTGRWCPDPGAPVWATEVATAVKVIGALSHLPGLPRYRPNRLPGGERRGRPVDDRILDRVRHLLSKAESTTFPDEAEALTAKAQELLTRHSIDRAVVDMADGPGRRLAADVRRIWIDDPYIPAKAQLLHVVASVNRCCSVIMDSVGMATVTGHDDDLDTVEILFTSLLVQATTQMTAAGSRTDRAGRSRTRSFRQSFLVAFAIRIGQRLRAEEEASTSAGAATYGNALLPVLASRASAAEEAIDELFPDVVSRPARATDIEGWHAGTLAADLASLSYQPELSDAV